MTDSKFSNNELINVFKMVTDRLDNIEEQIKTLYEDKHRDKKRMANLFRLGQIDWFGDWEISTKKYSVEYFDSVICHLYPYFDEIISLLLIESPYDAFQENTRASIIVSWNCVFALPKQSDTDDNLADMIEIIDNEGLEIFVKDKSKMPTKYHNEDEGYNIFDMKKSNFPKYFIDFMIHAPLATKIAIEEIYGFSVSFQKIYEHYTEKTWSNESLIEVVNAYQPINREDPDFQFTYYMRYDLSV